ncbi:MAG: class I SAM-dependent methyltransferase [Planctomycetota bacterium]|nr:MAG: class I SAM-dependent methyltransferase [Planctomycetota bacterium]
MSLERVLEPEVMDTPEEAEGYDAMDHREPNEAFVARLIELGAGGFMLDIGTGPGHLPILICERIAGTKVLGLDLSENMLRLARGHAGQSPFADRLQFEIGDAKGLNFPDHHFDTVYSNTILHHIPDPAPFLKEAWRVLKPGGTFLIRDLFRPESEAQRDALVEMHASDANPYQKELFRASLHAALRPEELNQIAGDCGLDGAQVVVDSDRHMSLQKAAETND